MSFVLDAPLEVLDFHLEVLVLRLQNVVVDERDRLDGDKRDLLLGKVIAQISHGAIHHGGSSGREFEMVFFGGGHWKILVCGIETRNVAFLVEGTRTQA